MKFRWILVLCILFWLPLNAHAVSTDGRFNDWKDKPYVNDPDGDGSKIDDLVKVGWFPDLKNDKLYFMLTRSESNKANRAWWTYVDIKVGDKYYYIDVKSIPQNGKVKVWLYDKKFREIWSVTGYWCDDYETEFAIPLSLIVETDGAGYSLEAYIMTDSDKVPDNGYIVISTISTYPYVTLGFAALLIIFVTTYRKKGKLYDSVGRIMGRFTGTSESS